LDDVASSTIPAARIAAWESDDEDAAPTVKQLRALAKKYKRPLGVFYLSEPPEEDEVIPDFRRMPDFDDGDEKSPELRLELRLARERREEAIELGRALGELPAPITLRADAEADPDQQAAEIREMLGVSTDRIARIRSAREAFLEWRSALEKLGVLVFQTGGMRGYKVSPDEARGFVIADQPFPVVVANGSDPETARSFSLMHEFVHVLLSQSGLCDQHERRSGRKSSDDVEIFCNRVAGAVLVPRDSLLTDPTVRGRSEDRPEWPDEDLHLISRRFHVSAEVVMRRLVIVGRASNAYYSNWRASQEPWMPSEKGFLKPVDRVIKRNGRLLPRLVLLAKEGGEIPRSDIYDLLSISPSYISEIESRVFEASD